MEVGPGHYQFVLDSEIQGGVRLKLASTFDAFHLATVRIRLSEQLRPVTTPPPSISFFFLVNSGTLMGCADPHQCPLSSVASYLCNFMLTCEHSDDSSS